LLFRVRDFIPPLSHFVANFLQCFQRSEAVRNISTRQKRYKEMGKPLDILDPAEGLALVSRPIPEDWFNGKTPEEIHWQVQTRQFWKFLFEQQLAYQAGDPFTLMNALYACSTLGRTLPPWLTQAILRVLLQHVSDAEKRRISQFEKHRVRWQAVRTCRVPQLGSKRLAWEKCWSAAADLLANTAAKGGADTVQKSYSLMQAAGGENATPKSLKAELARQRKRRKN
jgi:hypothetical protein